MIKAMTYRPESFVLPLFHTFDPLLCAVRSSDRLGSKVTDSQSKLTEELIWVNLLLYLGSGEIPSILA